jgi:CRP-like cAMP-binding protein
MNGNVLKFSVDAERLWKLGPNSLQSKEGQNTLASERLKSAERFFISLASSAQLNTALLPQGKKIIEFGEHFDVAHLVLSGEVQILQKDNSYKLGAGSVIGLSEGMVGQASIFSATALTSVQVKSIPFHRVNAAIKFLPMELRVILLTIINRNLAS